LSRGDVVAKSIGGGDTASDGIDGSLPSGAISENSESFGGRYRTQHKGSGKNRG